jgi:hypothetical protein
MNVSANERNCGVEGCKRKNKNKFMREKKALFISPDDNKALLLMSDDN